MLRAYGVKVWKVNYICESCCEKSINYINHN